VLDLGCGKGADMRKFDYEKISGYVGMDISMGQLVDALNRKVKSKYCRFPALFIKEKGQSDPEQFKKHLPKNFKFDIISAQFCIHYFFESEKSVRNFLQNISDNLNKNGLFFATFPDSKVIAKKFQEQGKETPEGLHYIGNKNYSIVTNIKDFGRLSVPFGNKYGFYLADGLIGSRKENDNNITRKHIPEYLIISDYFIEIAKEYNLEVVLDQNFHTFYAENISKYFNLFQKIGFNTKERSSLMDEDLWDCSYLYKVLMLKKTKGESMKKNRNRRFEDDSYWEIKNDYDQLYSDDESDIE
jgi:mRNA (guanine-N7-)-methyltransferase